MLLCLLKILGKLLNKFNYINKIDNYLIRINLNEIITVVA